MPLETPEKMVLAVTDDLIFRSRIEVSLKRAGIPVRFVPPRSLLESVRSSSPVLVLVDYGSHGEEAAQAVMSVKQDPATRSVPVLAYGAHLDQPGRERARAAGADAVLANSEVASRLPELVREWAERQSGRIRLRLGHSPDPDDAFMFFPLARGKIDTGGIEFVQVLQDIESLNRMALEGAIEITAASVHAYGHLADRYAILTAGGSFGDGYGPLVVSRSPLPAKDLSRALVAVPGTLTSAYLALRLHSGEFRHLVVPFDRIPEQVLDGSVDAGLIIHEGQVTYGHSGLHAVLDLGAWWRTQTGLPLPLGVNLIRKDLQPALRDQVARILRSSIDYALAHRSEALDYAIDFGRGLSRDLADRFVGMYVNDLTRDAGERGRRAIAEFLDRGFRAGLLPRPVVPEFVEAS